MSDYMLKEMEKEEDLPILNIENSQNLLTTPPPKKHMDKQENCHYKIKKTKLGRKTTI